MGQKSARQVQPAVSPVILLVESDDSDVFLFRRAAALADYFGAIRVVRTLTEAVQYLRNEGAFENKTFNPRPRVIFCDVRLTANAFLLLLQAHPLYSSIPVIVHSGVAHEELFPVLQKLGAVAFLTKTPDIQALADRLKPFLPRSA